MLQVLYCTFYNKSCDKRNAHNTVNKSMQGRTEVLLSPYNAHSCTVSKYLSTSKHRCQNVLEKKFKKNVKKRAKIQKKRLKC